MLNTDIKKIDFWGKNLIKSHHVNLDVDLDCIILFSIKDQKLWDLLYNKIVDAIIDRIHPKNTYKDLSNALENINAFLSNWKRNGEKISSLHAIIGVYHQKTFYFSTIWDASCYLYNTHGDVIEVTDKEENPKDFNFISSGDIADGESLIVSTMRLLDILSKDDIKDGLEGGDIERSGENIEHILLHEHTGKNIGYISFKKQKDSQEWKNQFLEKCMYTLLKIWDNNITKKILWYIYFLKDRLIHQSQNTRKVLYGMWAWISVILLYFIVSSFFHFAANTPDIEAAKTQFALAQSHISKAGENMNDPDMFSHYIDLASEIVKELQQEELFLHDVEKLQDTMGVLQKQFNGIEPFEVTSENTLYSFDTPHKVVKILSISNKVYAVYERGISWPIIQWETAEDFIFEELSESDYFIDATVYDTNIILITHEGKIVNFAKNNYFSYLDVSDQATWEKSPLIASYGTNLYLLSDTRTQILRHKRQWNTAYEAGVWYLKDEDILNIGKIVSLAIDGWIYILKEDGSVLKLFRSPEYRLEGIVLNKLPRNYDVSWDNGKYPSIRARADLKYVYMLVKNKIFIFQPNTIRYQDVKSLEYLGQVEGKDISIEDFYVDNDGEIFLGAASWVYKLEFDVVEGKIILK